MNSKIKTIIIIIVLAALLAGGYYFFVYKKSDSGAPLIQSSSSSVPVAGVVSDIPQDSSVGQEFLSFLLSVRNIKLDDSVFSDSAFATLRVSSIDLVQDGTEGRANPFAAIGSENPPTPAQPVNSGNTQNTLNELLQ